jgi:hypothetical protein
MRLLLIKSIAMAIFASLGCLVQVGGLVSGQSRSTDSPDKAVIDLFVHYPQNDLNVIVYSHARREPMEKSGATFYSTWFLRGNPGVVMATIVDNDGQVFTCPLPNSEVGPTHSRWKRLANVDISDFLKTVGTLPETTAAVALPNLVIVSFRLDGKWQTRLYDRTRPPAQLTKVYALVHSPLDSN